ncbi:MAG: BON domain-containing protein [Pseudomonadota bacterium]|nr:BON domain-containing protein [Pseudomonadota bacterium]
MLLRNKDLNIYSLTLALSLTLSTPTLLAQEDTAPLMTDPAISDAIEDELAFDPGVSINWMDIETTNGIVTLSGKVKHLLAKQRAVKVAQTVKGVRAVVNQLEVVPTVRSDETIEQDVKTALADNAATDAFEVSVTVAQGVVTLTGTVDSWQEKSLATKSAQRVKGVQKVNNDLVIDYQTERQDNEIEADIKAALRWDVWVDDSLIVIKVEKGEVELSGTVGSAAAKERAILAAKVVGVSSVDAAELKVDPLVKRADLREDKYVEKTDAQIQAAVEDALLWDPRINKFDLSVSVSAGVATLRGVVDNLKAKRAAARDARDTAGIWRVVNRIKVRPEDSISDEKLVEKVNNALQRDPYVTDYEIGVLADNGVVSLVGDVTSFFEKAQAEDIASRVNGVIAVHNRLTIEGPPVLLTTEPTVDDWSLYDFDWYRFDENIATIKSDWEILEDIKDQLWWSFFVDEEQVAVTVDEGVATLTGTVDTWSERLAATENALEGGAVAVNNQLKVKYAGPE